jgi:hypothetical protein
MPGACAASRHPGDSIFDVAHGPGVDAQHALRSQAGDQPGHGGSRADGHDDVLGVWRLLVELGCAREGTERAGSAGATEGENCGPVPLRAQVIGDLTHCVIETPAAQVAFPPALDAHKSVGFTVHGLEVLILLVALAAWLPRLDVGLSLALAAGGTVQIAFASSTGPWVAALHPLGALLVLALGALLARRALARLRRATARGPR